MHELCPMTDRGLDPLRMMDVCFYTADDKPYVLPWTDQEGVAVKPSDELLVRTVESGDKWLV